MERHLAEREFLVGERYTVADIALYGYTNVAEEGGFELGRFPAVRPGWHGWRRSPGTSRSTGDHIQSGRTAPQCGGTQCER